MLRHAPATSAELSLIERCNRLGKEVHTLQASETELSAKVNELLAEADEHTQEMGALRHESKQQTTRHGVEVGELKKQHKREVEKLQKQHGKEVADTRKQCRKEAAELLSEKHKEELAKLNTNHKKKLLELTTKHKKAMKALVKEKVEQVSTLRADLSRSHSPPSKKARVEDRGEASPEVVQMLRDNIAYLQSSLEAANAAQALHEKHEFEALMAAIPHVHKP